MILQYYGLVGPDIRPAVLISDMAVRIIDVAVQTNNTVVWANNTTVRTNNMPVRIIDSALNSFYIDSALILRSFGVHSVFIRR